MSDQQHRKDLGKFKDKHFCWVDSLEDGRCLNRHQGRDTNSCSHQWQAGWRAAKEPKPYNWPAYSGMAAATQVFFQGKKKAVGAPAKGDWDVKDGNFDTSCNVPYFHEAHHIVPNSTLGKAIAAVFKTQADIYRVRGSLLDAKFNLNYMRNMIILPLDPAVAKALKLPRHRILPAMSHRVYSDIVQEELQKTLMKIAAEFVKDAHKYPNLKGFKDYLDVLATHLYWQILEAGKEDDVSALDEMPAEWFDPDPDNEMEIDIKSDDEDDDDAS